MTLEVFYVILLIEFSELWDIEMTERDNGELVNETSPFYDNRTYRRIDGVEGATKLTELTVDLEEGAIAQGGFSQLKPNS